MPDNLHSEHAQSRLAKRLIFRVMSYALTALIMLLLIQFYATYRLQIENRSSAINTALNNINPILELALWNYNFEEIFRLGESLNNDPQVSGVLIRDESRNTVFEAGLVNNLHKLYAKSEQIHELQLADSSTAYARQVWYRGAASEPLKIGEVIIGSEDDLIWREIFDTIVVLVIAQLVFVAIVLLVLYLAMQTVVSARLLLLGRSISKMEKDIDPSIELELETLISGNDELSDVYFHYADVRSRLKDRDLQLQSYHRDLEWQVNTRTAELKKANTELRESFEKLQMAQTELVERERLASLGGLVTGIAHEVNTPLGVSITATSFLQEEIKQVVRQFESGELTRSTMDEFLANGEESCAILSANLERAASLVKSFKQVAVDQSSEDLRTLTIAEYIHDVIRSIRPQIKRSKVRIVEQVDCNFKITTFPGALAQVITNLIMNAYIHAYDNGARNGDVLVKVSPHEDDAMFCITIRDYGHGMSPDIREKIYEPFFTTRRSRGGSGLGLNIVFNLVNQKLNGRIECISEVNKGTEFIVILAGEKIVEDSEKSAEA